ncbi:acyl-CoA N-acyltransferase [Peniophora sp. CONT]|nr:acyl-CoA N-acyltransferase [Peniophora sp. CONT]
MPFETSRTILREYRSDTDADKLLAMWNDPDVQRQIFPDYTSPRTKATIEDIVKSWQKESGYFVIVEDKETSAFLGQVSFTIVFPKTRIAEVGISLVRESWGKGYGTELMEWAVQLGFEEWGLHRIQLSVSEENERAIALYKHIGFTQEGFRRDFIWSRGRYWGMVQMSILESEWDVKQGKKRRKIEQ